MTWNCLLRSLNRHTYGYVEGINIGQTSNPSWHKKRTFPNYIVLLTLFSSNVIIFKIYNGIIYNIRILSSMSYIGNSWLMISFMKANEYQFFKEKIHKKHILAYKNLTKQKVV